MTTRTDVVPDYYDSPRVLEVAAPSTEMTMQDLVDTVRKLEDSFQGMGFKKLINASGKEDLGGGVQVGVTVSQQDTKLAFEGRTTPVETGTVSTNPGSPITGRDSFTDAAADFVAALVARGSLVLNWSDRSLAEVISVDSTTKLTTKTLVNGVANTYTATDIYSVFNIVQCNATGGNLVAVDDVQASISAILPTAFTQVVLTASASATTQNQGALNFATYQGGVTIDPANTTGLAANGTEFPAGTALQPVLTLADAQIIAVANGLNKLFIRGDMTFAASENVDSYIIEGEGSTLSTLTFTSGVSTVRTIVNKANVTGDVAGAIELRECHVLNLTGLGGTTAETNLLDCILEPGTVITMGAAATFRVNMINCSSGSPGDTPVTINWSGTGPDAVIRKYSGGLMITNVTNGQDISHDGDGHFTVAASCTDGTAVVRGDIKITDNSTGTFTVVDQGTYNKLLDLWARLGLDPANPMTTNDDNSVTVGGITIAAVNGATDTVQTRTGEL